MARPEINSLRFGKISLMTSATTAGRISTVPTQRPMSRASISGG